MVPSLDLEVYNMLITTLFLLFVLTTVALLIFLLMRRPPCCPCCQDPYDTSASTNGDSSSQTAHIPYLTETHGIVVKKWMKDSPPPYESPPEYSSLSPELIMDAKTLQELANASQSQSLPVGVHTSGTITTSSSNSQGRSSSPLCTTPLFSTSFCDTPRSLTPTVMSESKVELEHLHRSVDSTEEKEPKKRIREGEEEKGKQRKRRREKEAEREKKKRKRRREKEAEKEDENVSRERLFQDTSACAFFKKPRPCISEAANVHPFSLMYIDSCSSNSHFD